MGNLENMAEGTAIKNPTLEGIKKFVSEYDSSEARSLSEIPLIDFRSTGSIVLDNLLGWGIPKRAITEISGKNSSWKTSVTMMTIKTMQDKYDLEVLDLLLELIEITNSTLNKGKIIATFDKILKDYSEHKQRKKAKLILAILKDCKSNSPKAKVIVDEINDIIENKGHTFYMDVEWAITQQWAIRFGLDYNKITVVNSNLAEEIFEQLEWALQKDFFEIIVVDSIWVMAARAEDEASMDQQSMGLKARVINRGMRLINKAKYILNAKSQPSIIMINHVYATMDQWAPEETPGGSGLKFWASCRLKVIRVWNKYVPASDVADDWAELEDPSENVGTFVRFQVVKNKVSSPAGKSETKLIFKRPLLKDWSEYDKITMWFNIYSELTEGLTTTWILQDETSRTLFIWKESTYDFIEDEDTKERIKSEIENLEVEFIKDKGDRFTSFASKFKKELLFNDKFFKLMFEVYNLKSKFSKTIVEDEFNLDDLR